MRKYYWTFIINLWARAGNGGAFLHVRFRFLLEPDHPDP